MDFFVGVAYAYVIYKFLNLFDYFKKKNFKKSYKIEIINKINNLDNKINLKKDMFNNKEYFLVKSKINREIRLFNKNNMKKINPGSLKEMIKLINECNKTRDYYQDKLLCSEKRIEYLEKKFKNKIMKNNNKLKKELMNYHKNKRLKTYILLE